MDYGLAAAGTISNYFVQKLPLLRVQLGPVGAPTARLASRIVNKLRAGHAQRSFAGFKDASLILVCAPGGKLPQLIPAMLEANIEWKGKALVLCNCGAFSGELGSLRERGASAASLHLVPGTEGLYVVEGDPAALRAAKNILREVRGSAIDIRSDGTDFYRAALTISSSLLTPLLESCSQALRGSGVTGRQSSRIVEAIVRHSLRTFLYSGRRSWSGAVAQRDEVRIAREIRALETLDQELAQVYHAGSKAAVALLRNRKTSA